MTRWYRVFAAGAAGAEPAELLEHLQGLGLAVRGDFRGDDEGWFRADLVLAGGPAVELERFLASEPGVRAELNSWAAWLETQEDNPHHGRLMERVVGAAQVFTLHAAGADAEEDAAAELCLAACQFLAHKTGGVYQADGQGFYDAGGALLLPEAEGEP